AFVHSPLGPRRVSTFPKRLRMMAASCPMARAGERRRAKKTRLLGRMFKVCPRSIVADLLAALNTSRITYYLKSFKSKRAFNLGNFFFLSRTLRTASRTWFMKKGLLI